MTDLRAQLQSSLGDAYAIERELGGGGMSRVFVATEKALGRQVVIKVLPSEMAGAVSIERFKREIAVAARLQQANIVPVLSAGDSGGVPYFTMPYVTGESLRARLASGGELPIPEAVGILKEIARALAYAHEHGVVHRDIKPDNVLLSGGSAMVTDFGVAKALSAATTAAGEQLTGTGLAIGTPAYMSPEQATGDPLTDHRADIYSFGCLAYELLAGAAPFAGRTPQQTIAAQMTESPDPVERRRPGVPWQLAGLVVRCLAKRAADRPQRAQDLIAALDQAALTPTTPPQTSALPVPRWRATLLVAAAAVVVAGAVLLLVPLTRRATSAAPRSIAVMPLSNKTGDTTLAYLAEGLSDELRSMLQVPGLSVKARSSSMKVADSSVRVIGKMLSVDAVLEGTLAGTSDHPSVVIELVQTSDETTLWSGAFTLATTGSSTGRDSLTQQIASALRVRIGDAAPPATASRGTANDSAYNLYLRGEFFRRRFDYASAVPVLQKAVAADPRFARAHAALAIAFVGEPMLGIVSFSQAIPRARTSADRAMALTPNDAKALVARGLMLWFGEWRLEEAENAMREAVAADPTDMEARVWYAYIAGGRGRIDDASRITEETIRLDPLSVDALVMRQAIHMVRHEHREAIEATRPVLDLDPVNTVAYWNLAESYVFAGMADSAVAAVEKMLTVSPGYFGATLVAMYGYASAGRWDKAREMRRRAERERTNSPNYYRAVIGIVFGDHTGAMESLERGVRAREALFSTIWMGCEPIFEPLHKDPRFEQLLREFGITLCPVGPRWPIGPAPKQ